MNLSEEYDGLFSRITVFTPKVFKFRISLSTDMFLGLIKELSLAGALNARNSLGIIQFMSPFSSFE